MNMVGVEALVVAILSPRLISPEMAFKSLQKGEPVNWSDRDLYDYSTSMLNDGVPLGVQAECFQIPPSTLKTFRTRARQRLEQGKSLSTKPRQDRFGYRKTKGRISRYG